MSANPYDPITTTDTSQLADDDWGLNLPNIKFRNYESSRFKGVCGFLRERVRLVVVVACIFIISIVLVSIIVVATQGSSHRKTSEKDMKQRWRSPAEGLAFYPVPQDGSTVISFSVDNKHSPLIQNLTSVTEEYQSTHQLDTSLYTDCTEITKPADKVCRLFNHHFGEVCTKHRGWGYPSAMPCVFLQLNLPDNVMIKPIPSDSILWPVGKYILGNHTDSSYVPVSCEGTTHQDRLLLGIQGFDQKDTHPIQYFPRDGLPSFFYRQRNTSLPFLKPAMMIRLTSLKDRVFVRVTCTVWGQLYDFSGKMQDHELLKTTFGVYISS